MPLDLSHSDLQSEAPMTTLWTMSHPAIGNPVNQLFLACLLTAIGSVLPGGKGRQRS